MVIIWCDLLEAAIADAPFTSEQRHIVREFEAGRIPWWDGWWDKDLAKNGVIRPIANSHFNTDWEHWGIYSLGTGRLDALIRAGEVRDRIVRMPKKRRQISNTTRRVVLERDGFACVNCGAVEELELDHVYPHSQGGSDQPENIQAMCGRCNRTKGAKLPSGERP